MPRKRPPDAPPVKPRTLRTAEEKAAARAAIAARAEEKLQRKVDTKAQQALLHAECTKLPPGHWEWGYVRTHAWQIVAGKGQRIAKRKTVKLEVVRAMRVNMEVVMNSKIEDVAKMIEGLKPEPRLSRLIRQLGKGPRP